MRKVVTSFGVDPVDLERLAAVARRLRLSRGTLIRDGVARVIAEHEDHQGEERPAEQGVEVVK
jgi:hypothetical protein